MYIYLYNFIYFFYFYFLIMPFKLLESVSVNLIDFNFRNDPNEYFFNCYSILWTVIWYFSIYFLLLALVFIVNSQSRINYFLLINLSTIIWIYVYELNSFCFTNVNSTVFNNYIIIINFLLLNVLNKYHPFLFYLSVSAFFFFYMNLFYRNNLSYFLKNQSINYLIKIIINFVITAVTSIILGSWWAFQEGSWEGWWNWDPSESFGLLLLTIIIISVHYYSNFKNNFLIKNLFNLFLIIFISIYCLLQISYASTSHNFGIKFFYFFNNSWFLSEIIILSIIYILINTVVRIFFFLEYLIVVSSIVINFFFYEKKTYIVIFFISAITLIISFKSLILLSSWNLTLFNYWNVNTILNNFLIYLFLLVFIFIIKINNFYFFTFWSTLFTLNFFLTIIKFTFFTNFLLLLHSFFALFCFYNLNSSHFYVVINGANHVYLNSSSNFFNWNYLHSSPYMYYISHFNLNKSYNFCTTSTFMEYLTKNLNLLQILYTDNIQLTKTSVSLNRYLNKTYVEIDEFYNEIILKTSAIALFLISLIILKKSEFIKIIN